MIVPPGTATAVVEGPTVTGVPPGSGTGPIATDAEAIGAIVTGAQAAGVMSAVIGSGARFPAVDPHQDRTPDVHGRAVEPRAAAPAAHRATAPGVNVRRQAQGRPVSVGSQPHQRTRNAQGSGKTAPGTTAVPSTAGVATVPSEGAKEPTAGVPGPTTPGI
ncbi:hypothetical protein [Arthrobacter sp. CAN_A6]|uniref:hypothetical protein n=1 Tax=Arthrobacter sp. CAN_A6 TaxID=2787721 RepID=UPI002FF17FF9